MDVGGVFGQGQTVARAWDVDGQDLADGGRRAVGHHHDAVREQHGFIDIVSDHDDGVAQLALDLHHLILQVGAGEGVEGAKGLIHQQHLGLHRQCAGDADTLFHATRDLRWALVHGVVHVHQLEVVLDPVAHLGFGHLPAKAGFDRQFDVLIGGQPRQQ